jgi:hypothetical protein
MGIILRELKEDLDFLRNFANINGGNEIGQRLHKILDYVDKNLKSDAIKELKSKSSSVSFWGSQ